MSPPEDRSRSEYTTTLPSTALLRTSSRRYRSRAGVWLGTIGVLLGAVVLYVVRSQQAAAEFERRAAAYREFVGHSDRYVGALSGSVYHRVHLLTGCPGTSSREACETSREKLASCDGVRKDLGRLLQSVAEIREAYPGPEVAARAESFLRSVSALDSFANELDAMTGSAVSSAALQELSSSESSLVDVLHSSHDQLVVAMAMDLERHRPPSVLPVWLGGAPHSVFDVLARRGHGPLLRAVTRRVRGAGGRAGASGTRGAGPG